VGWVTGHSYIVYGPLLNAATVVLFEGIPTYPTPARFWELIDKHRITIFYTAPTAIRALEALGTEWPESCSLDSLRVLGTVGEPINQEAWHWYHRYIGRERCPIVDTWWQTETGMMMITTLAGVQPTRPAYAGKPLPGVVPVLMDEHGQPLAPGGHTLHGRLCLAQPWPSMARTTWGDHQRFIQTYFSTFQGYYFTGDGALLEPDGYIRITGRVDDVINVSGHRIGTAEVEDALNEHPHVVESAVVGYPHDIKGQAIYAFVVLAGEHHISEAALKTELNAQVTRVIGALARPDKIQIVRGLPKTRSGKIMRRILRKLAEGECEHLGDTSTLLDPSVVDEIKQGLS
jgi:acetyl-CoA synthetase